MRQFLQKLRFGRMDEMERAILHRAQRNSYLFLMVSLLVWSLYESWKVYTCHSRLNLLPSFLLGGAALIQSFTQLILQRNAVKDDEDSQETGPLLWVIVWICAIVGIAATVIAAGILMGVHP